MRRKASRSDSAYSRMSMRLENAVAKQRVDASKRFGHIESGCVARDALRGERRLHRGRNGLLGKRMRQRLAGWVIFQYEVAPFVGLDQNEDRCGVADIAGSGVPCPKLADGQISF